MRKKPVIKSHGENVLKMGCPNCGEDFLVRRGKNRWAEWFGGECETCGYNFLLRDYEFDFVQPNSPFFEMIYKFHPERQAIKKKKEKEWRENQRKAKLEEKYFKEQKEGKLKAYERKAIEKEVLKED